MRMKRLLSLLCVLAMLASLIPAAVLPVSAGKTLVHRKETTLLEKIIERDGFVEGIWYPWFTHEYLGCGLTSNELAAQWLRGWSGVTNCWYDFTKVGIDEYGADKIYREIYNLKSLGYNLLGYEGSIYGEGVIYDDNGDVLGIKQEYLYNVRRFLDMCRSIGMPVLWTVCCHSSSVNSYYTNGKLFWDKACRFYSDPVVADHYAERFVKPLAKVLKEYDDVVAMVAVTSEAENEMNDSNVGNHFGSDRELYGTTQENMLYFVNAVNEAVKSAFPAVPRTICCQLEDMSLYSDVDFDLLGDQNYNWAGRSDPINEFRATVPMFVSEFGLGDNLTYADDELTKLQITFRDNFRKTGYKGCVMWCWQPDSKTGSAYDLLKKGAKNTTDFRSTAYDLYYYFEEQRDKYRGDKTVLDTPQLFYVSESGLVEWVAPRQATKMDLLRSDDGGKTWEYVLKDVNHSKYVTGHKGQYLVDDPTANTVCKVVVRDGKGNEKSSRVSNRVGDDDKYGKKYSGASEEKTYNLGTYPLNLKKVNIPNPMILTATSEAKNRPSSAAVNLLEGGSFESSLGGFASASTLKAVTDKTAPDGNKSLYFDTSSTAEGQWHIFWVEVDKYTDYVFSAWVKGADLSSTNRGYASVGVVDPDTKRFIPYTGKLPFYTQSKQIVPSAWDGEWHLRAVGFNSQNRTKVGIAVYGGSSKMWVDDMALYKNGDGVKYASENMTRSASYRFDVEHTYCAEKNSVIKNPTFDKKSSDFWQTGGGWDSGFLSIASNKYEYGASLKYTATANPVGLHYIKWVDVEPNTWYTFSVDMKILKSGSGRLALLDGKMRNPVEIVSVEMDGDSFGKDWFSTSFRLNTGVFTRVGIAVVDAGGSALIDNLRLFKTADGIAGDDDYVVSGGSGTRPTATAKPSVNTTKATTTKKTTAKSTNGTTATTQPVESDELVWAVTAATAEVWTGAGEGREVIGTLNKDAVIEVLAVEDGAVRIFYNGVEAYVSADCVAQVDPATLPSQEEVTDPSATESTDTTAPTGGDTTAPTDSGAEDTGTDTQPKDGGNGLLFVWIGLGAVVLIGGGIALFLILRKKKKTE